MTSASEDDFEHEYGCVCALPYDGQRRCALFCAPFSVRYEALLRALARCVGGLGVIGWIKVPFSLSKAQSLGYYFAYYFAMSDFYRNFVT